MKEGIEPLDDMMEGEREIGLGDGLICTFEPHSLIQFYRGEEGEPIVKLEPSMLSALYGAYRQMIREMNEKED